MKLAQPQPGERFGCLELVGLQGRGGYGTAIWLLKCECGMHITRQHTSVSRWKRGIIHPPYFCRAAHDADGKPAHRSQRHGKPKCPQNPKEKARRERSVAARAERKEPSGSFCPDCFGLTHRRIPGKRCSCDGWYAEETIAANDTLLGCGLAAAGIWGWRW